MLLQPIADQQEIDADQSTQLTKRSFAELGGQPNDRFRLLPEALQAGAVIVRSMALNVEWHAQDHRRRAPAAT